MRQFDVEAKKLNPDVFISGLIQLPSLGGYRTRYSKSYASYGPSEAQFSYTAFAENRQISKNGVKSYELDNLKISGPINDFTLTMICMPTLEQEIILDAGIFKLDLVDLYRYKITAGQIERVIPFDQTCHYLSISRTGSILAISISGRRIEVDISVETIQNIEMFSGPGSCLIDKLVFSKTNEVPPSSHYDALTPSGDLTSIGEDSFIEWIFADEIESGRIFSGRDSNVINGKYIITLVDPGTSGASLRNLSEGDIEVSYDRGATWLDLGGLEKIPTTAEVAFVRSDRTNFEFVVDNYKTEAIKLPGVDSRISGTVYPYHRDERTYYTNATYDFSNATLKLTPIEEDMPKSIWIYGKLSSGFLDSIDFTFLYRDGKAVTGADIVVDKANHLYLIGIPNEELILNPQADSFVGINAIGVSEFDQTNLSEIQKTFDVFAGNAVVAYAEEVPSIIGGKIGTTNNSFRVIDVQWTM